MWSKPQEHEDSDPKIIWEIKTADEAVAPFAYSKDSSSGYMFESEKDARKALKAANEVLLAGPPSTSGEVSLAAFMVEMRKDLDRFEAEWRKNSAEDPEKWPKAMRTGDWYEQFLTFESSGMGGS